MILRLQLNFERESECNRIPSFVFLDNSTNPPKPCWPGYYCPLQSPSPEKFPCPAGTYSDRADLYEAAQCYVCPQGSYCEGKINSQGGLS